MSKKKTSTNYRYISVETVDDRLLDFALLSYLDEELSNKAKTSIIVDPKLMTKVNRIKEDKPATYGKVIMAYNLYSSYFTYNELVTRYYELADDQADQQRFDHYAATDFMQQLQKEMDERNDFLAQYDYLWELITFYRLYKKGRYAADYLPQIIHVMQNQFEGVVERFSEELEEDEWIASVGDYFEQYVSEMFEEKEQEPQTIETVDVLKEKMLALLDDFAETMIEVDPEEFEAVQQELQLKETELKQANKLLKSKDELISKLQKTAATKEKESNAIADKYNELKKLEASKASELGKLRKQTDGATEKYDQLTKRYESLKETMQKEVTKAREQATQPLQVQLNEVKNDYEYQLEQLQKDYKLLKDTVNSERKQFVELETEAERLRKLHEIFGNINADKLALEDENEQLKKQVASLNAQLANNKTVAVATQSQQTSLFDDKDDVVVIDDDIFGFVTNAPSEDEQETAHLQPVGVVGKAEQPGTIKVVTEENEINFDELLSNRPE